MSLTRNHTSPASSTVTVLLFLFPVRFQSVFGKKPGYRFFTVLVFPYKKCLSHYT